MESLAGTLQFAVTGRSDLAREGEGDPVMGEGAKAQSSSSK